MSTKPSSDRGNRGAPDGADAAVPLAERAAAAAVAELRGERAGILGAIGEFHAIAADAAPPRARPLVFFFMSWNAWRRAFAHCRACRCRRARAAISIPCRSIFTTAPI